MGSGGSREAVVIPVANTSTGGADAIASQNAMIHFEHQRAAAEAQYRQAEDEIFREGYKRGRQDTLETMEAEISKAARVAYASEALAGEKQLQEKVHDQMDTLQKHMIRPPFGETACKAEEAALLACDDKKDAKHCVSQIDAYVACADRVVRTLIDPKGSVQMK